MRTIARPCVRFLCFLIVLFAAVSNLGTAFAADGPQKATKAQTDALPQARVIAPVDNSRRATLAGHVPRTLKNASDAGRVAPSTPAEHLIMTLKSSSEQEREIRRVIDGQQDKKSVNYHQWMTPEDFGQHFGVDDADIAKVTAWLKSQGFTVESVTKAKRAIVFSGNIGQVEQAFRTEMHYFRMPSGEMHVSNNSDISVPEALHPVISGVPTLNNFFHKPHHSPIQHLSRLKEGPKFGSGGSSTFVGPSDFATIYNTAPLLASGIDGTGVTIAIVGRSDILMSDVQTYRQMFNLPVNDPIFINAGQDNGVDPGDDGESDLDVEISGGIAPGATVKFVIGTPTFLVDGITNSTMYIIENNLADIISTSYGDCELNEGAGGNSFNSQMYEQAAAQGISVFVADGDNGPAECDDSNDTFEALGYAASAEGSTWYGVSVGGTQFNEGAPAGGPNPTYWTSTNNALHLNSAKSYIPEYPWNEAKSASPTSTPSNDLSGLWSGSGGISAYYLQPPWQRGPSVPIADPPLTQGGNWIVVNITNPGAGYISAPSVTFTGETCASNPVTASTVLGTGAQAGQVVSIVYNFGAQGGTVRTGEGFGCTAPGAVAFTAAPAGGTTAMGTAVLAQMQDPPPLVSGVPHRYTPDLALNAAADHDGTLFCSEGICEIGSDGSLQDAGIVGGTSVAAPSMAGIQALIDQANGGRQGMPAYIYYSLAAMQNATNCNSNTLPGSSSTCAFQDVTTGNNLICGTSSCTTSPAKIGFQAGTGYDFATGLGSVNAANLSSQWSSILFNSSTTTLNLSQSTFAFGTSITLSGTVMASSGTPTGDVAIIVTQGELSETVNVNTGALNGPVSFATLTGGTYSLNLSNLPAGTYYVTARYGGDDTYASSTSASTQVIVSGGASNGFTLTASLLNGTACTLNAQSTYSFGNDIMIDAQVTGAAGVPTGTVAISLDGNPLATLALDPNGHAFALSGPISTSNCLYLYNFSNVTTFAAGAHTIAATYSGDSTFSSATATPVNITISPITPTVSLAAGATNITSGFSEQLTATFGGLTSLTGYTPGTPGPSGTVTFKDNTTSTVLGTGTVTSTPTTVLNTGLGGTTTLTAVAFAQTNTITATGANSIVAIYSGDSNYATVTSTAVTVTVGAATTATTTAVTSSANPTILNGRPTFTATVSGGAGPTTGTVTFYDGTAMLGTGTVGGSHTATFRPASNFPFVGGVHNITATFGGLAGTFGPSTSPVFVETVTQGTTTTILSAKTVGVAGQSYYFTATITPSSTSTGFQPTAAVQFFDGGNPIGSAPLQTISSGNGGYGVLVAALPVMTLTAGSHSITAQYPGDVNYTGSTSNTQTVFVGGSPTLNWTTPAAITYGTPLSATQLDATDTIPGTYVYTPVAGTVLNAGPQSLSVTFTAADYKDFPTPQSTGVTLMVNPAGQAITFTMNAPSSAAYNSHFTVAASGGASGNPVVFTSSGSCSNAGATYTMTSGTGTCTVIANQAASSNYSAAPQVTQSVNATMAGGSSISVTVTVGSNSIYPKQSDPLTATVTVVGGGGAPQGAGETVTFYAGATPIGTGTLSTVDANDSSTTISIAGSQLVAGANSITAVYVGDADYSSSTSLPVTVTLLSPFANFAATSVGTAATSQTLTYTFSAPTTLTSLNVLTSGASGLDYTNNSGTCAAGAYTAGQNCTVVAAFMPTAPGARAGAATLYAQGSNMPLMTWYLSGVGQSGAITIDPGTLTTTTLTGTLTPAGYGSAVDGAGNVYVVDHANNAILKLAAGTFSQSTVVSGLSGPTGVALDGAGNLYISNGSSVVMVPNENGTLTQADQSTANISGLGAARGIALDASGNLYVADATNNDVVELSNSGAQSTIASGLTNPHGVAVDAGGNVYVATNNNVTEYPFGGGAPVPYGTGFNNPRGVAVDAAGNVYVADTGNNRIVEVAPGGATQAALAIAGLSAPQGVSLDSADNLYVTDPNIVIQDNRTQAAALSFPSTNVGSDSAAQNLTVSDSGNAQLQISNLAISPNFTQGISGGTDCTSSTALSSAGQCLIAVEFAPTMSGTLTGTLTLVDNALNDSSSTQTVQLSGGASQVGQTITFTMNAPVSAIYNTNFTVAATGGASGNPVAFTSSGACSNVGATFTMTSGTGTCSVIANQAGNAEYSAAPQVTQTTNAVKASQSIGFTTNAPSSAGYQTSFTVAASATSSLAVAYTSSGVCTNSGATYTMTAASGTCTVIANQAGNGNYTAAAQVTETSTASKATPTVTFTGAPATAPYQSTFTVTATTNASTHAVITAGGACTIAGTTVTISKGSGTCTTTAKWAADSHYLAASLTQSTTAEKLPTTVSWSTPAPITYGTALSATQLDATASVAGNFVYTPASGKILIAGSQTLSVKFTPTNSTNYSPSSASVTLTVGQIGTTTTITSTTPSAPNMHESFKVFFTVAAGYGKPTQSVTVTSYAGGPSCTGTLSAGKGSCTMTFATAGPETLTATYSGDSNDQGSTSAGYTLTIGN
jgi:sugar lactone lactonase YvrE